MATIEYMPARLTPKETEDLRRAIACLEGTSFAQRLTDAVGRPVGMLSGTMPQSARRVIAHVSEAALRGALKLALRTLDLNAPAKPANRAHKLAAAASGAVGGALGLAALPVELPISTTILLRSIAEIARQEGEDLTAPGGGSCLRRSVRSWRPRRRDGLRKRIFHGSRRARQVGQRQRALRRQRGRRRPVRARHRAVDFADCRALSASW